MSLYVGISVNRDEVVDLQVQRVTNTEPRVGGTPEDEVNLYEIRVVNTFTLRESAVIQTIGHRYGDGAIALARRALQAVEGLDLSAYAR